MIRVLMPVTVFKRRKVGSFSPKIVYFMVQ